jgi:hypothetical protein
VVAGVERGQRPLRAFGLHLLHEREPRVGRITATTATDSARGSPAPASAAASASKTANGWVNWPATHPATATTTGQLVGAIHQQPTRGLPGRQSIREAARMGISVVLARESCSAAGTG